MHLPVSEGAHGAGRNGWGIVPLLRPNMVGGVMELVGGAPLQELFPPGPVCLWLGGLACGKKTGKAWDLLGISSLVCFFGKGILSFPQ